MDLIQANAADVRGDRVIRERSELIDDRRSGPARRLLALLAVFALVVAACGGDDDGAAGPSDDGTTETSEGGDAGELSDVDPDGIVKVGYDLVQPAKGGITFDPVEVTTQITDQALLYLVYGSLLRPLADGSLEPDLAESTEVVDDQTITVTLREGITFSDGTPLDADAVKASIERNLTATDSPGFATPFFDLETIEATSPTELTLTIPNGTAASWHDSFLGSWETVVVPPGHSDFSKPIGAGPMVLAEWTPEQSMRLEKNPEYWDAESILVAGMDVIHAPADNAQARSGAFGAGQVDFVPVETTDMNSVDGEVLLEVDANALGSLMLCKRDGPLADVNVRKAMNKAIDRAAISEAVYGGAYEPSHGLWPDGHRFHDPAIDEAMTYDVDAARGHLADSEYPDGFEFDLYVLEAANIPVLTQVVQSQLAEIGITANLVPSANYVADFLGAQKDGAGAVPTMSPNRQKLLQWSGESVGNTCFYEDPELERLKAELSTMADSSDEAVDLWHQIEQYVVEEQALSVLTLFSAQPVAWNGDVLGEAASLPYPSLLFPDPRITYVKA